MHVVHTVAPNVAHTVAPTVAPTVAEPVAPTVAEPVLENPLAVELRESFDLIEKTREAVTEISAQSAESKTAIVSLKSAMAILSRTNASVETIAIFENAIEGHEKTVRDCEKSMVFAIKSVETSLSDFCYTAQRIASVSIENRDTKLLASVASGFYLAFEPKPLIRKTIKNSTAELVAGAERYAKRTYNRVGADCNGIRYKSFSFAWKANDLPPEAEPKFRMRFTKNGKTEFTHNGKVFKFSIVAE